MKGFNARNKNKIVYISVASVTTPILAAQNNDKNDFGHVTGDIEVMEIDEEFINE